MAAPSNQSEQPAATDVANPDEFIKEKLDSIQSTFLMRLHMDEYSAKIRAERAKPGNGRKSLLSLMQAVHDPA